MTKPARNHYGLPALEMAPESLIFAHVQINVLRVRVQEEAEERRRLERLCRDAGVATDEQDPLEKRTPA